MKDYEYDLIDHVAAGYEPPAAADIDTADLAELTKLNSLVVLTKLDAIMVWWPVLLALNQPTVMTLAPGKEGWYQQRSFHSGDFRPISLGLRDGREGVVVTLCAEDGDIVQVDDGVARTVLNGFREWYDELFVIYGKQVLDEAKETKAKAAEVVKEFKGGIEERYQSSGRVEFGSW